MPRLCPLLKGQGRRLEFVVGVMKVTNGRKGDAPRRECTALGRDEALEAARLWQECADAREFASRVLGGVMNALMDSEAQQMCGAGRNERSDGRRPQPLPIR